MQLISAWHIGLVIHDPRRFRASHTENLTDRPRLHAEDFGYSAIGRASLLAIKGVQDRLSRRVHVGPRRLAIRSASGLVPTACQSDRRTAEAIVLSRHRRVSVARRNRLGHAEDGKAVPSANIALPRRTIFSLRRGQADGLADATLPASGPHRAHSFSTSHRATSARRVGPLRTHAGLRDRPAYAAQRTDGSPSKRSPATSRCQRALPTARRQQTSPLLSGCGAELRPRSGPACGSRAAREPKPPTN